MARRKRNHVGGTEISVPTYLNLIVSSEYEVTRDEDPEDRWSVADTYTSWSTHGVELTHVDDEHALPADFQVAVGDEVHVVYLVYSTGDSFHREEGKCLEVISFHKNSALAHENAERVRTGPRSDGKIEIEFDSGAKVKRYCNWDGYFESIDNVHVESFVVSASR